MKLVQLVYVSRPFGFDDLALNGILAVARRNNARDDITGALVCREDLYIQWLEGPQPAVAEVFARIRRDERHTEVTELLSEGTEHRLFPNWSMRHDPAQSWMWSREDVSAGAAANASAAEVRRVFEKLAASPAVQPQTPRCPVSGPQD